MYLRKVYVILKANTFCTLKSNYVGKRQKKTWQNLFLVTEDNAIRNSNGNKDQCVKFPTYKQTHTYLSKKYLVANWIDNIFSCK